MKNFFKAVIWMFAIAAFSAGVACFVSDYLYKKRSVEIEIEE